MSTLAADLPQPRDLRALKARLTLAGLLCLLLLTLAVSLGIGAAPVPWRAVLGGQAHEQAYALLWQIRLPRLLLSALVGAALATSGAAIQGLFRNPLADPGLIGISSGAALAVAMAIVLFGAGVGALGLYGLSVAAFVGGVVSCLLVLRFAHINGRVSVTHMLLAGIAISALSGAGTGVLTYLSDDQQLRSLTFWTMGSLGGAMWPAVAVGASTILPGVWLLLRRSRDLNILLLGEREAEYLGVNARALKHTVIGATALMVGVATALTGMIGFLGLVVPHLVRLVLGPDHRALLPASALLGAALLALADTIARTVAAPAEMPVGILTSLIGGPFFLWLLSRQYRVKGRA